MRRSSGFFIQTAAIAFICLFVLSACQKEMPGRLDGKYPDALTASEASETKAAGDASSEEKSDRETSQTTNEKKTTSSSAEKNEKIFSAPKFKSGSYTMESSSVNEQYFYSGKSVISYTRMTQIYNYDIKLAVNNSGTMTAVYTFKRIRTGYETDEGAIATDTSEKSGRNEDNAVYYDLIGQRFTVNISKDYKISVKGIDAIHKKFPYTSDIVTDDNMKEVASDLFYRIDRNIQQGSSWQLKQVGLTNTYTVSSIKDGSVYINIKGKQLEIPKPYTNDGIKYTYKKREPLSGSLVMALDNRMMQEQSSYQENSGVIESGDKKYTFTESAASICNIKQK